MTSSATQHFVRQRLTALIQVPLVIWLIVAIVGHVGDTREEMLAWVAKPWNAALIVAFFLSVPLHMSVGIGDVIDDYLHKRATRSLTHLLNSSYALIIGGAGVFSVIAITLIA